MLLSILPLFSQLRLWLLLLQLLSSLILPSSPTQLSSWLQLLAAFSATLQLLTSASTFVVASSTRPQPSSEPTRPFLFVSQAPSLAQPQSNVSPSTSAIKPLLSFSSIRAFS
jgi:hypothetical protein